MSGESTLLETPLDLQILKGNGEVVTAQHFIISTKEREKNVFAAAIKPR